MGDNLNRLKAYALELKRAGFDDVWLTPTGYRDGGYLTYRKGNFYGTLQYSDHDGWQHLMPLKPSREYGSHMFLDSLTSEEDMFTVAAAEQCAQAVNHNSVVGWQGNARTAWISPKAEYIEA